MADAMQLLIKSAFDASGVTAATNSIRSIDAQINRVSRGLSQFMGLMGAGGIGATVFAFGKNSVLEFAKSEAAVAKLTKAMQNLGTFTEADIRVQTDYARQLQLTTKYSDEDIIAIQEQLVTYGLYGEQLKLATKGTLDLATKTGSTESAAKLLGKAFQGQTDTLSKYGIKIDENTKGADKFNEVLAQVQSRLGGMAEVEGKSFEGRLAILSNGFNDLQENLGQTLMPVAERVLDWGKDLHVVMQYLISDVGMLVDEKTVKLKKELANISSVLAGQMPLWEQATKGYLLGASNSPYMLKARQEAIQAQLAATPSAAPGSGGRPTLAGPNPESPAEKKAREKATAEAIRTDKEYLRESQEAMAKENEITNFFLTEKGQMYTRFFGRLEINRRRDAALNTTSTKQLETNHKRMLDQLEQDYRRAGNTISGGWRQAVDQMGQNFENMTNKWMNLMNEVTGAMASAIKTFMTSSGNMFENLKTMFASIWQSILDSFISMVARMIAEWLLFQAVTGMGGTMGAPVLRSILGFAQGGYTGDGDPSEVAGVVHKGEYVLSADTVKAIRGSSPGPSLALAGAGAGGQGINITQHITLQGGGTDDIGALCQRIADATKNGIRQAGEMASVVTKVGAKKSGITSL
jgi:hypothetical protein